MCVKKEKWFSQWPSYNVPSSLYKVNLQSCIVQWSDPLQLLSVIYSIWVPESFPLPVKLVCIEQQSLLLSSCSHPFRGLNKSYTIVLASLLQWLCQDVIKCIVHWIMYSCRKMYSTAYTVHGIEWSFYVLIIPFFWHKRSRNTLRSICFVMDILLCHRLYFLD